MLGRLLTVFEAAQILGLSRSKVYQMIHDNRIPVMIFGSCYRIPEQLLMKMIQDQLRDAI